MKKATRFNEKQKKYLEVKFFLSQETGRKVEAVTVAQEMRYAKNEARSRRFTLDEFLTPQQVQSFFSKIAGKLKNRQEEVQKTQQPLRIKLHFLQREQIFLKIVR